MMGKPSEYVSHKGEGMYPGAHPTAPGGMSQKALMRELVDHHGWTEDEAADYSAPRDWPDLIEQVIIERQNREAEAPARYDEGPSMDLSDYSEEYIAQDHEPEQEPYDELASELDEMIAGRAEAEMERLTEFATKTLLHVDTATLDYVFDGHAGAGPSGSHRWIHCTASLGASRAFLETLTLNQQQEFAKSGDPAAQGTTAHAAAETEARVILGEIDQAEADATLLELAILPDSQGTAYDDEMAEYIVEYVALIKGYVDDGYDVAVEQRVSAAVPLTDLHEGEVYEITGSADFRAISADQTELVVGDLKYGEGLDVEVEDNSQAMTYALGVLSDMADDEGNLPEIDIVTLYIVQPRLGGIKQWTITLDDLLDWRDDVLAPALTKALYGVAEGATYEPSDEACQWCPARGTCPALAAQRVGAAVELFDMIQDAEFTDGPGAFPETSILTDAQIGSLLTQIKGVMGIYDDLKAEAQRRLYRGVDVPGWQLVNYTPPRVWAEGAEEALAGDDTVWVRKMITPAAATKLLGGAEKFGQFIEAPDKRPVIAPVGDRRKTWEGRAPEDMFNNEEEA